MPKSSSPLVAALQECSLYPLLLITARVLGSAGFGDVQILDRRTTKEKTRWGGYEIQCVGQFAGLPVKTIVKVIGDNVRLRMVDENAGAVIRANADLGLIVSPFSATKLAIRNLASYHGARVDIIDGKALAALMTQFGIGVRESGEVDYAFFGAIEEEAQKLFNIVNKLSHDD